MFPDAFLEPFHLHKTFPGRFRVDAAALRAQVCGAGRNDCIRCSTFQSAQCAAIFAAIDPVETGFLAPECRARHCLITAVETKGGSLMAATPPENTSGFA
jgi:hypothetical protein